MEKANGSLVTGHFSSFDPSTYDVVYRDGRPYYLREHSEERDFGERINANVEFILNYPFGLTIKADPTAELSFNELPMDKIRKLSLRHSAVLLRGFKQVSIDDFRKKAREMGDVM